MPADDQRGAAAVKAGHAREAAFLQRIHQRLPHDVQVLSALAEVHSAAGQHQQAMEHDRALTRLRPRDALTWYNLGCSCAQSGACEDALHALETAYSLGYRDFRHALEDHDLDPLRHDEAFQAWLQRLASETEIAEEAP